MAVTSATILAGTTRFIADVTWSADADTDSGNIAHGLGAIPLSQQISLQAGTNTITPTVFIKSVDATNIVVSKLITAAGSGGTKARVEVSLPHSLVK